MNRATLLMPLSMMAMVAGMAGYFLTPGQSMVRVGAFILTIVVVGMTSWSISDRPGPDPLDVRISDAAVIGLTFMALSVLALGTLGLLGWWMLVVSAGMAGSMWAMIDRRASFGHLRDEPRRIRPGPVTILAIGLASFAVVQAVLGRIFRPPVGDPLAYHLPFAVEWLQQGTLTMPVPAAGDPSPPFYPLNSSAWIFWLLAPFDGEILARFLQLPFLGLLALATYRLCRELNLSSPASAMAAALAVSVPSIARSASIPENDLILAALLVLATAYLVRLARRFTVWRAGITAAVIGLAVGTKVIALAFAGVLGLVWVSLVIRGRRRAGVGSTARLLGAGALIVLLVGGYSYIRNAVVMENPLYPAGYDLPGGYVLDGLYFPTWEWRQDHAFFSFDWNGFLFGMRRDFGWTVTAWAIPGVVLAGTVSIAGPLLRRRSWQRNLLGLVPVVWVGLSLLIFWYIIPYHFSRFLFPTIVMAIVAGMWGLGSLASNVERWRIRDWHALLAVPVIAINLINIPLDLTIRDRPLYWLAATVVIGGTVVTLFVARVLRFSWLRLLARSGLVGVAVAVMVVWPTYSDEYEERRIDEWRAQIQGFSQAPDAWQWLEEQTDGEPAVIAVAGTNESYPLYGPDLGNEVVTIWHSGELAEFGWGDPFAHADHPRPADWLARVQALDVDYVVVTEDVSFGGWPVQRSWMLDSPDHFDRVFASVDIEIWKVLEPPGEVARYTLRQGWINQFDWQAH